ncbi:protein phosphatase Slingshot homolog 2-like isoform X2 [Actinia tenebrosa]|uniref:protein-serine/threonine phosphatase n=1 Tax=Actinia tenebrosa TaxID=6105 RepID=A0A6P8HQM3_ACTTE|nr:protein phosphatase Slingshot homolog 2-like isoform X2 [Actinia tenebrosa]
MADTKQSQIDRSNAAKERFRRAARKVKNYWIFTRRSSFEGFFASKGSAFALPDGDFARKASKHGGEMQKHLQSMVNLLRDDDILRLVVKLEAKMPERVRYLTVVSSFNDDDIEESIAMGIDTDSKSGCTIGLVLPLLRDTMIEFDGDGGFCLCSNYRRHILKPVSVQTMWTAVQWVHRCGDNARKNNQFPSGQSHQWTTYYSSRISSEQSCIKEWLEMEDVDSVLFVPPTGTTPEQELMMKLIRHKLREVMMKVDLEDVTSRQIRKNLEEEMQMDLKEYKQYIDEEMLTILGQLDSASQIYDHVYLGSEWNASNLEELKQNGIGYILNISREIDNFFYGTFKYFNVRIYDEEESDLMSHWDKTYKFINEAKINESKVLVHCKMGMSRSASTVIAYGMKEFGTSLHDTMKFVKSKRACINPNAGFWKQLVTYEGILNSSKHRYNELFTSGRRRTNSADLEGRKGVKRRRHRRKNKSKTVTMGAKIDTEVITEDTGACTSERSVFSDEEADQDMSSPSSSGCEPSDDALKDWEKTNVCSNPSSPCNSRSEIPDFSKDELDDQIGGLVSAGKERKQKNSTLHRAHSVPSLISDASKTSEGEDVTEKEEGLHRCNSLREFLSGKVAALKKDYTSGSLGSVQKKHKKKSDSPEKKPEEEAVTEVIVEKTKLRSTLSDPTSSTSSDAINVKSEDETMKAEKEDVGSSPDQSHIVVHRDAHDVVKSGIVKRQSRNFEEGKVNLPWDLEETLIEPSAREDVEDAKMQENEPMKPEEQPVTEDEPPSGLVKMHAQKFQGNFSQEAKNSGSDCEEENESKIVSPDREIRVESLFPSNNPRKVVVLDANSTPIVPESKDSVESDRIRQEMLKARALFEQDVLKVNEDMLQEKMKRRSYLNKKSTEEVESQEKVDSVSTCENQECCSEVCEDVQDVDESSPNEDPRPGTVLKHLKAIKHKYGATVSTKSGVDEVEEDSPPKVKIEHESLGASKKVYVTQKSEDKVSYKVENPGKLETKSNENDPIDADLLLQKVNEDMKKEKEQRRTAAVSSDLSVFDTSGEDKSTLKDVTPEDEDAESLKEQDESETSEIPRPGIVKRSTDLLLGKVRLEEKLPAQAEVGVEDTTDADNTNPHTPTAETENLKAEDKKETDDVVDSSGIVSVKLRLKLMEEVIQGANERECHKQRTRSALAALEDKRERIESEQIKRESENAMKEREDSNLSAVEGDCSDSVAVAREKKTFFIVSDDGEDLTAKGNDEMTKDDLNAEESLVVGNVRLRTLLLEERIHSSNEDFSKSKPGVSVRRHESMPRSTRPVDRPVVRQRSLSDLNTGDKPSTSSGIVASTNRWSLDLRKDKNRIAKLIGNQDDELPDNDRDSEKFSDDMSEKSDKTDDCLSKPAVDIFELGDKDLELSKEVIQIPDLDNKDIV